MLHNMLFSCFVKKVECLIIGCYHFNVLLNLLTMTNKHSFKQLIWTNSKSTFCYFTLLYLLIQPVVCVVVALLPHAL